MPRIGAGKRKGGDLMSRLIDLTGQQFGRLVVIDRAENTKDGKTRWVCECDCGNRIITRGYLLGSGQTKSCGCLQKEIVSECNTKHGDSFKKLYYTWNNIRERTCRQTNPHYKDYGERGIGLCEEWKNYDNFKKWALSNGYKRGLTIDRIENDKGYFPDNCRWVSMKIQQNNKRNNRIITYNGQTKTLSEWAEHIGISYTALKQRINKLGWSIEKALTTPPRKSK
jgi:hypothetical protein